MREVPRRKNTQAEEAALGVGEGGLNVLLGIPRFLLSTLQGLGSYTLEELRDPELRLMLRQQGVDPEELVHEMRRRRGRGEPLGPLETIAATLKGAATMGYDLQRNAQGGGLWEIGPNGRPRLVTDNPEMSTREKARAITELGGNAALLAEGGARSARARVNARANTVLGRIVDEVGGPAARRETAAILPEEWSATGQRLRVRGGRATKVGDLNREVPTYQRRAGRGPSLPKTYAILTAENPGGVALSEAENASRMQHLRTQLRLLGREGIETQGAYTDPVSGELLHERGIMVKGLPVADAQKLSQQFGQNSFISQEGMHDLTTGAVEPIRNVEHGNFTEAPYTRLANGQSFRMSFGKPKGLADVASEYRTARGLSHERMPEVTAVDEAAGRRMAQTYEGLKSEPNNPAVREAYNALSSEIQQQAKALQDAGYTWDFVDSDPYPNSKAMLKDLRENRHINVLRTSESSGHPYLSAEQNDLFRAVHDIWGHGINEYSFGKIGEENAFRSHAHSLSPLAQRALATETRGQNSWFNFGPESARPVGERPFATQKAALWPQEMLGDYPTFPPEASSRPGHPLWRGEGSPTKSAEVRGGEPLTPPAPSLLSGTANRTPSGVLSPHTRLFTDAQWSDIFGPGPFSPTSGAPSLATLRDRFGPLEQRGSIIAPTEAGSILRTPQESPWAAPEPQRLRNYMNIRDAAARALEHPLVEQDVRRGVERGFHDWYNADPIAKSAIDALGPEAGLDAFHRLMQYMRPTSIASSPEPNLRLAGYQHWRTAHPEAPRFAPGYRPLYPTQIEAKIAEMENAGGAMNPVANPKLERYGQALEGNWAGLVGDRHFWRRMQHYGFEGNPKTAYGPVESAFADRMQQLADEGILPVPEARSPTSAGQAAIWGGAGEATGVRNIENVQPTFYRIFEDAIHRSSRHAGVDPLDFLGRFWRRETPIF